MKQKIHPGFKGFLTSKIMIILCLTLALLHIIYLLPKDLLTLPISPYIHQKYIWFIPNGLNVLSAFLIVGIGGYWLRWIHTQHSPFINDRAHCYELRIYSLFFALTILYGLGSIYFHITPNQASSFWLYLPANMTMMCFIAIIIADRINLRLGLHSCVPFVFLGMITVLYSRISQLHGIEDLRWPLLTYYLPSLITAAMILVYPKRKEIRKNGQKYLLAACLSLIFSYFMEFLDEAIHLISKEMMSGFFLKQIYLSAAFLLVGLHMKKNHISTKSTSIKFKPSTPIYTTHGLMIPKPIMVNTIKSQTQKVTLKP